ncbi:MAG: hypothetical protein Q8Q29_01835 [Actinomycetota bacterium]|jgi:hypothetical protein|nr:hypothetical protein [Actinomycetota bacterium]
MARLHVEGWAPEYGAAVDPDDSLTPAEGSVDLDVEDRPWEPIPGSDDGIPIVAFVDGVRRVEARLLLDDDSGPVPGICGSFATGAVVWDRAATRSEVVRPEVVRMAILAEGHAPSLPPLPAWLVYRTSSVDGDDPASLIQQFHAAMRKAEADLAEDLAGSGYFVVADGPLYDYTASDKMGYVKSHRRSYLPDGSIVGRLPKAHRTPLFAIGEGRFRRYSWYVRLSDRADGHSWVGVVRCEASAALDRQSVVRIADRSAAVLPLVGSEPHIEPRAPQNLVPIAALERDLRHRLGDAGLVLRALRSAVAMEAV